MPDFLEDILKYKRSIVERKKDYFASLRKNIAGQKFTRYGLFRKSLVQPDRISLIAEIKKASPSQGVIRTSFDPLDLARIYVQNGADALSILTEDKYFLGKPPYVTRVSEHCSVPILTKDFIIDEGQIYETFACGASALLLIAAILTDERLKCLKGVSDDLDLDCLVEVHDEGELERVLRCGADIIGVNNRDLRTFQVDIRTSERLIPKIPRDKIIVAESGIRTHEDVLRLKEWGAHAVLIGETFLRADDVAKKMKEIMYGES
ncbi:MAG: indole-3-glycerol phosphate synthase TrpC [Candidatus Omnitrophota bacterium]